MLTSTRIRWHQFLELAREKSAAEAFRKAIGCCVRLNRIVVPVYLDLSAVKQPRSEQAPSFEFLVLDRENAATLSGMNRVCSRRLKGTYNTASGYYAYAVASEGTIIGDIWCASPRNIEGCRLHPDLDWLGITCGANEAYLFDMYVTPGSRGKVASGYLLAHALNHLKGLGLERVYGFYEKENLPALWMHRLFGYRELPNRKVSCVLHYKRSEEVA